MFSEQGASRIDAEFASHPFINRLGRVLASNSWKSLREVTTKLTSGHTPYLHDVSDGDVGFITIESVKGLQFDETKVRWITQQHYETEFAEKRVTKGSVICTIKRRICQAYPFIDEPKSPFAINQDVALLTPTDEVQPAYLAAYLSSGIGQAFADRQKTEQMNPYISVENLSTLPVVILSDRFQSRITGEFVRAREKSADAAAQLAAAEQTMLHALGLDAWQPPEPLTYVRRASEALTAVRLDAEHFRPKFDDLIAHLMAGGDAVHLDQVLSFCERGRQPAYADEGVIVVNSRHVRTDAVIIDGENRFATVEDETLLIRHGDILLNGTGVGTIGRVTTYLHDTPALPDNHVTILRLHPESGFDPVFLAVQLAGVVGQTQVEQHTRGSSGQLELYPQDIRRILVWRAPKEMQLAVRRNIEAAHAARREAQALLARAQRAVEVAIEQGEPAALALLSAKIA